MIDIKVLEQLNAPTAQERLDNLAAVLLETTFPPVVPEYINNHIHEDIRIDSICEAIHVSKYYFCKKFKQSTGITVMNYILKTRIISATNLLESTDLPIGEISEKCGFSSPSFFSQAFRKEHGVTPRQYQQALSASDRKVVTDTKYQKPRKNMLPWLIFIIAASRCGLYCRIFPR